ncbi:MAG: GNAT family N-acetyltransferase [Chloroflexi bacterium]|nr:GNAT family N-acetyltransferase [Chloroflexota bacterium]
MTLQFSAPQYSEVTWLHQALWPDLSIDDIAARLDRLIKAQRNQRAWGLVARIDQEIVGFGQLARWTNEQTEICDLIVAPAWRSQGIGTQIILHLLEIAQQERLPGIEIGCDVDNPRAFALYQRLGFAHHRTVKLQLNGQHETILYLRWPEMQMDG